MAASATSITTPRCQRRPAPSPAPPPPRPATPCPPYMHPNTPARPRAAPEPGAAGNPLGTGLGVKGTGGSTNGLQNTVSRNNIWHNWKTGWSAFSLTDASNNSLDYDLTNSNCWWGSGATCETTSREPNGH